MSLLVQKRPAFEADFEELFGWYLKSGDLELAWRFQAALDVSLAKLSIRPDLGRPRHYRHPTLRGLRSFPVAQPFGSILIFYRTTDETLVGVRLMHGARNLQHRLRESPITGG